MSGKTNEKLPVRRPLPTDDPAIHFLLGAKEGCKLFPKTFYFHFTFTYSNFYARQEEETSRPSLPLATPSLPPLIAAHCRDAARHVPTMCMKQLEASILG